MSDGKREITPVAFIATDFNEKFGIPRQSGRVPSAKGRIEFLPEYGEIAFRGIEGFSHAFVIFGFHKNEYDGALTVRPPRLGGNKRVGVFATRSPFRPNGLGLSVVKIDEVRRTERGVTVFFSGADMLNGTPVYDFKPYIKSADCIENAESGFSEEWTDYALKVEFSDGEREKIDPESLSAIIGCLKEDPRPAYHADGRVYTMNYGKYQVSFTVTGDTVMVTAVTAEERE